MDIGVSDFRLVTLDWILANVGNTLDLVSGTFCKGSNRGCTLVGVQLKYIVCNIPVACGSDTSFAVYNQSKKIVCGLTSSLTKGKMQNIHLGAKTLHRKGILTKNIKCKTYHRFY